MTVVAKPGSERALAAQLRVFQDRLRRIGPSRTNPEAFHVERDQLAVDIAALANLYDPRPPRRSASTTWRPDP